MVKLHLSGCYSTNGKKSLIMKNINSAVNQYLAYHTYLDLRTIHEAMLPRSPSVPTLGSRTPSRIKWSSWLILDFLFSRFQIGLKIIISGVKFIAVFVEKSAYEYLHPMQRLSISVSALSSSSSSRHSVASKQRTVKMKTLLESTSLALKLLFNEDVIFLQCEF